jgi:hypothetical protein
MVYKSNIIDPHSSEAVLLQRCTVQSIKTNLNFDPQDIPISLVGSMLVLNVLGQRIHI